MPNTIRYQANTANECWATKRINARITTSADKTLYRNGLTLEEAKQQLAEQQKAVPELDILVDFLNHSTRGIVR